MAGLGKKRAMELFGATLKNGRWSWDGTRTNGAVVFIGWKDRAVHDGPTLVSCRLEIGADDSPGASERAKHIEAVLAAGGDAFLALAIVKDPTATPREIDAILPTLYRIKLEERDGEVHAVVTGVEPLGSPPAA